jgi:hypothetical protein
MYHNDHHGIQGDFEAPFEKIAPAPSLEHLDIIYILSYKQKKRDRSNFCQLPVIGPVPFLSQDACASASLPIASSRIFGSRPN